MTMTVYHLNIIANEIIVDDLNAKGWDGHELYKMHADITVGMDNQVEQALAAYQGGHYKAVAILGDEQHGLEDAFRLTNHIETAWTENPEVSVLGGHHQRSTSVGDIVELDGVLHLVAGVGFVEIGRDA